LFKKHGKLPNYFLKLKNNQNIEQNDLLRNTLDS
jgi:hypothetical protein